ncbi:MAG: hypothetical protein JST04_13385 [Bdellovibrionales bacterium]|nr:hypothetical protein [Bdellovibrionales bacterium]
MKAILTRSRVSALGVVVVAQALSLGSAFAVPSDRQAWSSQEYGITVYADELDSDVYWFVPKIRFETSAGKTVLRPHQLADGKTEYITRIIPYFPNDMRELITENIPGIRMDSQLKPIVAKSIGVSLPDFSYKTTSESVTSIEYLNVPRLVRFSLDKDEAELFDSLIQDDYGVSVAYTFSYDGVTKDKYYQIGVSCKDMYRAMTNSGGVGAGVDIGKSVHLGAEVEAAFKKAVQANLNGIDIVSKGDNPDMTDLLRQTMDFCFQTDDGYGGYGGGRGVSGNDDDNGDVCKNQDDCLDPDANGNGSLLPKVKLKAKYRFKQSTMNSDRQASVKQVGLKDAVNTSVIFGALTLKAPAENPVESALVSKKTIKVGSTAAAAAPFTAGIQIVPGNQYTINAEYTVKVRGKAIPIDASWPRGDGDLYFRIGSGAWEPVGRHLTIGSDVARGGGELQFYVDASAFRNRLPKSASSWGSTPEPEFAVEISTRRLARK